MTLGPDLLLDDDGDLSLVNGDFAWADGAQRVAQAVRVRLLYFLGEWFLDVSLGVPWYESILVKSPNLAHVATIMRGRIADTLGVDEVTSLELDLSGRTLSVTWAATTDGTEISGEASI